MSLMNRRWLLARHPEGAVSPNDFCRGDERFTPPPLAAGEVLVKTEVFSCAPTIRNWMNPPGRSYRTSIAPGTPIIGVAAGAVIASQHPSFTPEDRIAAVMPWADYAIIRPDASPTPVVPLPAGLAYSEALGTFGLNTLTGYFGMRRVCAPQPGEVAVISGAAGATGSVALQVARNLGARTIGIAGGAGKCARLIRELGADAAIDYKAENVAQRLQQLASGGVNMFFDTVGGALLDAVIDACAPHARIALCGQIAAYDGDRPAPGPRDMMKVVYGRLRLQGFVTGDYAAEQPAALQQLRAWHGEGRLQVAIDLRRGFDNLPEVFLDLFQGRNRGALLVQND